jgi:hypothetical protein
MAIGQLIERGLRDQDGGKCGLRNYRGEKCRRYDNTGDPLGSE